MFYFQRQQAEPVPLGYHNLEVTCRAQESGVPYLQYILNKSHPEQVLQKFTFQEYVPHGKGYVKETSCCLFFCDGIYGIFLNNKVNISENESVGIDIS